MENRKLYGRYDEKAGTYTLPKNAPPEHALIAADIDRAAEIASGIKESIDTTSGVPKGLMFIHEGNGVKFHICTNCKETHEEEPHLLYQDAIAKPNGIVKQATIVTQKTSQNKIGLF